MIKRKGSFIVLFMLTLIISVSMLTVNVFAYTPSQAVNQSQINGWGKPTSNNVTLTEYQGMTRIAETKRSLDDTSRDMIVNTNEFNTNKPIEFNVKINSFPTGDRWLGIFLNRGYTEGMLHLNLSRNGMGLHINNNDTNTQIGARYWKADGTQNMPWKWWAGTFDGNLNIKIDIQETKTVVYFNDTFHMEAPEFPKSYWTDDKMYISMRYHNGGSGLWDASFSEVRNGFKANDVAISSSYNNNILTVNTNGDQTLEYQYWIRKKVITDNSNNLNKEQYIWHMFQPFGTSPSAGINVSSGDYLINDNYEVLVRVKDGTVIANELYGQFSPQLAGQVKINTVKINGESNEALYVVDKSQGDAYIEIFDSGVADNYKVYSNDTLVAESSEAQFLVDMSLIENGLYNIRVVAEKGLNFDEKIIKVYVFGVYEAQKIAVIESLTGITDGQGFTTFTMQLKYADGTNIDEDDADKFTINLTSEKSIVTEVSITNNAQGVLEAVYTTQYNKHGIYRLQGSVRRNSVSGQDDGIIVYYNKHARTANIELSGNTTEIAGNTLTITAINGSISGGQGPLTYAFYREDASGWVLIKDYSESNVLNWTPTRAGKYVIQARVKAQDSGNYEKAVSKEYTITSNSLSGNLTVNAYNYNDNEPALEYQTGAPYKIVANYSGSENVLFMFTVQTRNQGVIYLNTFTTSNTIMFVPNKNDTFIITARVISVNNFGFKDISETIEIISSHTIF